MKILFLIAPISIFVYSPSTMASNEYDASTEHGPRDPNIEVWHHKMRKHPYPKAGCFSATYPNIEWIESECSVAPKEPHWPPVHFGDIGGNNTDYRAHSTSAIHSASGTLTPNNVTSITDSLSGSNSFSVQLNTNLFHTSTCTGGNANCIGWQQFIWANDSQAFHTSGVFMQYWLIDWGTPCPSSSWTSATIPGDPIGSCYMNSGMTNTGTLNGIATATVSGGASVSVDGGVYDDVVLTDYFSGTIHASNSGATLHLDSGGWTDFQFNLFGLNSSSKATFNNGASLNMSLAAFDSAQNNLPLGCVQSRGGYTAETSNLSYIGSCCPTGAGINFLEGIGTSVGPDFCLSTFEAITN